VPDEGSRHDSTVQAVVTLSCHATTLCRAR
jgi:hypothetical protein